MGGGVSVMRMLDESCICLISKPVYIFIDASPHPENDLTQIELALSD